MTPWHGDRGDGGGSDPQIRRARTRATVAALLAYCGDGHQRASPAEELVDALFIDAGDGTGWLTGVCELSVSFRDGAAPTVRSLAEVLQRRPPSPALTAAGLAWGTLLLRRAASCGVGPYAAPLFREVYETVYGHDPAGSPPPFRFGIATELGCEWPIVKVYFDLYAAPPDRRRAALDRVATLLGERAALAAWARDVSGLDLDTSRVIGVDFGPAGAVRSKFYWGARHLPWAGILAAAGRLAGERHVETLGHLKRELLGAPNAVSSVLLSMCGAVGRRSLKVDVCVARLFDHDGAAYDAIERFRRAAAGEALPVPAPLRVVTGGLEPRRTRCVQQYLGVELPTGGRPRVTVYYRPLGFETEHLNPVLRPRACV